MLLGKLSSCACSIFQQEVLRSLHQNWEGGLQFVTVNGDINPGVGPGSKVLPRSSAALLWERQHAVNSGRWSLSEPGETPLKPKAGHQGTAEHWERLLLSG